MQNKIEHLWSVLCASSTTDKDTNIMSLYNLVDQLNIESLPQVQAEPEIGNNKKEILNIPVMLEIVSFLQRHDTWKENPLKVNAEIQIFDPKDVLLNTGKFEIVFPQGFKRLRYRTMINGIGITLPGEYHIKLKIDYGKGLKQITNLPLDVKFDMKFK